MCAVCEDLLYAIYILVYQQTARALPKILVACANALSSMKQKIKVYEILLELTCSQHDQGTGLYRLYGVLP